MIPLGYIILVEGPCRFLHLNQCTKKHYGCPFGGEIDPKKQLGNERANVNLFGHGRKSLIIVETFILLEPFGNETSFVRLNRTISTILDLVDPFTSNHSVRMR